MERGLKILLAEDNRDHAELTIATLQDANPLNQVIHVQNGELMLKYLRHEPPYEGVANGKPDLIMMDIKMPRLNGKEALSALKADPALRSIPVIMITTSSDDAEVRECFKLGASSYVIKPVEYEHFVAKLEALRDYWTHTSELPSRGRA